MLILAATIIIVALIFDYLNGFHDAANSIATVVATKVLKPSYAVAWAAFFNFVAVFFFETHVAGEISKGVIKSNAVDGQHLIIVVLGGLLGAILWNLITWYFGLPTSSSHALVGGLIGAVITITRSSSALIWGTPLGGGLIRIITFIFLSPIIGLLLGYIIMRLVGIIFRKVPPGRIDHGFRIMQLVSAATYSLAHGLNDAQKTMGVIWILLISLPPDNFFHIGANEGLPYWVKLSCNAAIALGTLSGGWRIVKTMGVGITKLKPVGGFSAETAAAISIIGVSLHGIPVSTTHTITGAIVGVGATNRLSAVRWGVAGRIVWAWILTIPASALMAALACELLRPLL